ncbi:putative lipoprotein [Escherichia coli]|nr:hypothetical protein BvCmsF14A_02684 [Escherichia coli]STH13599.1 putative lipoprotein [Escherichia coli]
MMMNAFFPAMALMVLVGCSTPSPVQKAQRVKVDPLRSLNMEALCKDQAAKRYNTGEQKIDVTAFEQFQGSYEMRGYTFRKEQFVCSFDADGQFFASFHALSPAFSRFVLYIFHPAGILIPSFKSTRIQHEIICKSLIPGPSRA